MRKLLIVLVLVGCGTTKDQGVQIVREGQALLVDPQPQGDVWEKNRQTFLQDASLYLEGR